MASEPIPAGISDKGAIDHFSTISIGSENKLVQVPIDDEITVWLNTVENSDEASPPTPKSDAWHPFTMPSGNASVIFDSGTQTSFDVLEILAYPDGLNDKGVPVSVTVHPLCGPQAESSCKDVAWGDSGVQIPLEIVEAAIAETKYYAIGGILLPNDSGFHPDSFMALLRKQAE